MVNSTMFVEEFTKQMFNPECSYLMGMMMGTMATIRYIVLLFAIYFCMRFIDKFALEPLLEKIKCKLYKPKRAR